VRDSVCAQRSLRGKGMLIARTDETNPVAIRATRNQSQIIQRRTSRISCQSPRCVANGSPFTVVDHADHVLAVGRHRGTRCFACIRGLRDREFPKRSRGY
jgi:hypothetical protein